MNMRKSTWVLSLALVLPTLSACGDDAPADGDGDASGNTDTSGDGDGDGNGDGDGDPTTGDGDGDPTTGDGDGDDPTTGDGDGEGDGDGDVAGYCAQGCVEDEDCCPIGVPGCPGDDYPNNYACGDQGVCEFGGCASDADCGGLLSNNECHPINDQPTCFAPCSNDLDCVLQPGTSCSGMSDDAVSYCAPAPQPACEDDADCGGFGICDVESGECYCSEDSNCTVAGFDTCVAN